MMIWFYILMIFFSAGIIPPFQSCMTGPGWEGELGSPCHVYDEDGDGDIDLFDWAERLVREPPEVEL